MLPTTEDREDLASAQRAAQEEEVVQLLHEQQQIVVTTDAVSEDGDAATDATSARLKRQSGAAGPPLFQRLAELRWKTRNRRCGSLIGHQTKHLLWLCQCE